MHILPPIELTKISPRVNKEWAANNNIKNGDSIDFNHRGKDVIVEDSTGYKKSFDQIAAQEFVSTVGGPHLWTKVLPNGTLTLGSKIYKIDELSLEYFQHPPTVLSTSIDLTQFVLAVLEYVGETESKFVVTSDGKKKPY